MSRWSPNNDNSISNTKRQVNDCKIEKTDYDTTIIREFGTR